MFPGGSLMSKGAELCWTPLATSASRQRCRMRLDTADAHSGHVRIDPLLSAQPESEFLAAKQTRRAPGALRSGQSLVSDVDGARCGCRVLPTRTLSVSCLC